MAVVPSKALALNGPGCFHLPSRFGLLSQEARGDGCWAGGSFAGSAAATSGADATMGAGAGGASGATGGLGAVTLLGRCSPLTTLPGGFAISAFGVTFPAAAGNI
jgi:hypothetical protein